METFAKFEHEGWQRVAGKYDSVWASSTRQFIPPLLDAAEVTGSVSVLDVGCGPGYVAVAAAERGATSYGLDFSKEMVASHKKSFRILNFEKAMRKISLSQMPPSEFRRVLERVGFNGVSMFFKLHTVRWNVPSACYPFDAERNAGVRSAGLLARQTSEKLRAIQLAIEKSVCRYAEGDSFSIPKGAYIIAVSKNAAF
jgi:SAM-dependent methyltransferase